MKVRKMGYLSVWKVLEEAVADFRRKGVTVPAEITSRLRSARILINVLKTDTRSIETSQEIEKHLLNVESFILSEGQKRFGAECVQKWLKKLDEASRLMDM